MTQIDDHMTAISKAIRNAEHHIETAVRHTNGGTHAALTAAVDGLDNLASAVKSLAAIVAKQVGADAEPTEGATRD